MALVGDNFQTQQCFYVLAQGDYNKMKSLKM